MTAPKIYVASSWRNAHQPGVVSTLRDAGYEVYDFRNPGPNETGFSWAHISADWMRWSVDEFRDALHHPTAAHAFRRDEAALRWCDCCVLVLPSGMSAHLEAGWCAGSGKPVIIFAPEFQEAELMYRLFDVDGATPICSSIDELLLTLARYSGSPQS